MPSWREVIEFPQGDIISIVENRLLTLPQDPDLYLGSSERSRTSLANLVRSSHYPVAADVTTDESGSRLFFTAIAILPQGLFSTFGMETSPNGQFKDVNIGLHVQGKTFTPEGLHILRYNSPHLTHSKRDKGSQAWHFDVVLEDGREVRFSETDGVPETISLSDLFGEWYNIASQAKRLVQAPYYKWEEEFSLPESQEKMQAVADGLLSGMQRYPPFKQALAVDTRSGSFRK